MLYVKRLKITYLLISFLIIFTSLIFAQEVQQKEAKQEVTEEFFYAEEEVEIASLKPQPVEEAPVIVSIITAQQIKDMGARNLNDILRIVPGFQHLLAGKKVGDFSFSGYFDYRRSKGFDN